MQYKLVVVSKPFEGSDENEFNRWYQEQHLADVVAVKDIISAQRFQAVPEQPNIGTRMGAYLAIYEIETDDLGAVVRALEERAGTDAMPISDTLDINNTGAMVYTPFGAEVLSK